MTTERQACGLGALLPMSCRGRAEAFARRLQTRLQHLGGSTSTEDPPADTEETWLTNQPHFPIQSHYPTNHQPRLNSTSSESDVFYDFDMELESPGSPLEEATEEIHLNKRRGRAVKVVIPDVASGASATSPGSDSSDGNYYDPESFDCPMVQPLTPLEEEIEAFHKKCNGNVLNGAVAEVKAVVAVENGLEDMDDNGADLCNGNEESNHGVASTIESKSTLMNNVDQVDHVDCIKVNGGKYLKLNGGYSETETEEICDETKELGLTIEAIKIDDTESITCPCVSTIETIIPEAKLGAKEESKATFCSMFTLKNECMIECPKTLKYPLVQVTSIKEETSKDEEDDDDDYCPPRRVQRCSSLKTGKTPPGTPGRKKIVRFADVLGLDLADIRTFLDEIPKVPTSAYEDLTNADLSLGMSTANSSVLMPLSSLPKPEKTLMPLFQQPGGCPDFLERVRRQKVCLENAMVKDMITCMITGTVRVLNLDFNKSVHIRYSLDEWKTFADLQATYVMNSCDGFSDTFSFSLYANSVQVGQRLEFAVRFQCHGIQYWDNNCGKNYVFQCLPPAHPTPCLSLVEPTCDRWASFY